MMVKEWLREFILGHQTRNPGFWPERESPEWQTMHNGWLRSLIKANATQPELAIASREIQSTETWTPADHLAALLAGLEVIRERAAGLTPTGMASDRETAKANSAHCAYCSGSGLAPVFHPDYKGAMTEQTDKGVRVLRTAAHCLCMLGRWMRANSKPEVRAKIPDFLDVRDGKSEWIPIDPHIGDTMEPEHWDTMTYREKFAEILKQG